MSESCELPLHNATPQEVRDLLRRVRTVAVVGLSDKPERDSHRVAAYLQQHGYRVIPVNPALSEALGEKAYARVQDVPEKVDLVDVFRKPEAVPEVVEDAIAAGAGAVWLQEGIVHNAAADRARAAGLQVVMNKCVLKEHHKLTAG
jgi:predicted CoA-binding protein